MSIEITPAQRSALEAAGAPCIHLHDPETSKVYLLIEEGVAPEIDGEHVAYMRKGLDVAEEQVAQGKVRAWSTEEIISRGNQLLNPDS